MDIKEIFSAIEKHLVPRDKRTIDDEEAIYGVFPKIDQTIEERKKIVEDKKKVIESDSPWDAIPMAPQQFIPLLKNIGIFAGGAAAIDQGIKKIQEHPEVAKAAGLSAGMMLATMALMNRGKGSVKISPVLQKETGAFRPDDSLSLRSSRDALQNEIEGNKENLINAQAGFDEDIAWCKSRMEADPSPEFVEYWTERIARYQANKQREQDQLNIYNRLSPKQIDQYGTTKFSLDPALEHVRNPEEFKIYTRKRTASDVKKMAETRVHRYDYGTETGPNSEVLSTLTPEIIKSKEWFGAGDIDDVLGLYYNYLQATKNPNKTFYNFIPRAANEDIQLGIKDLLKTFEQGGVRIQDFEKKPLDAIVQKYLGIKKDLLKQDTEILKNISHRTEQLRKTQNIPFEGIVRIDDPVERAADTWCLNICLGSYSNPSGKKYLAAYHPATGQPMDSPEQLNKGFWKIYQDRVNKKAAELYSYRPNGIPELAIDWSPIEGIPMEIRGINNADPTKEQLEKIKPFIMDLKTKWKKENPGKVQGKDRYFSDRPGFDTPLGFAQVF
jgi:hypothetical protein